MIKSIPHTPRPWVVSRHEDNNDIVIRDAADAILANCSIDTTRDYGMTVEEHDAINMKNAALMASAPELLNALHDIITTLPEDAWYDYSMVQIAAMDAIAKARGEK